MGFADDYARLADGILTGLDLLGGGAADAADAAFNERALALFDFQMRWNEGYRKFCAGHRVDDWKSIPAVPTAAFRDLRRPVACFPIEQAEGYFETSGTTGEVRGRHYFYRLEIYRRAIDASLQRLRCESPALHEPLRLRWLPGLGGRSSLRFMFEYLSGEEAVEDFEFGEPLMLMGTALSFLHRFETGCQPLPEGSWVIETGGYKGSGREISKPELYAMFRQHLGVPAERIVNEYGMTELSSQFYAVGVAGYHRDAPLARVVVRSPETGAEVEVGDVGYVTVCDLANIGSVMAVATQDLAVRREAGRFELLGRDPAAIPRGCSRAADEFLSR